MTKGKSGRKAVMPSIYCHGCKNQMRPYAFRPLMRIGNTPLCIQCENRVLMDNGVLPEAVERICHMPDCDKRFVAQNKFIRFCPDCKSRREELKEEVESYKIIY